MFKFLLFCKLFCIVCYRFRKSHIILWPLSCFCMCAFIISCLATILLPNMSCLIFYFILLCFAVFPVLPAPGFCFARASVAIMFRLGPAWLAFHALYKICFRTLPGMLCMRYVCDVMYFIFSEYIVCVMVHVCILYFRVKRFSFWLSLRVFFY